MLKIEKISGDFKVGDTLTFDKVLLKSEGEKADIGTPHISGAKVTAELTAIGRAPKVTIIKYKQKSRYFNKNGHRQPFFQVKVKSI